MLRTFTKLAHFTYNADTIGASYLHDEIDDDDDVNCWNVNRLCSSEARNFVYFIICHIVLLSHIWFRPYVANERA